MNVTGSAAAPIKVRTDSLRYRVRFKYPIDPTVDSSGGTTVDPAKHYLLDVRRSSTTSPSCMSRARASWLTGR